MRNPLLISCLLALCATHAPACATQDPSLEPLRAEALDELRATLQELVESRNAGLVALVSRGGRTEYFETSWPEGDLSLLDAVSEEYRAAERVRYARDTIIPIGSLTMPITTAAALTIVEEGRLALDDPLSKFLPEFAAPRVWVVNKTGADLPISRPAAREIRIADLLAQTSGLSRAFFVEGKAGDRYADAVLERGEWTTRDLVRRLAMLPLDFDPGIAFSHGPSADVLGVVLEKIEGRPLPEILEDRVFKPLGMRDTAFRVTDEKRGLVVIRSVHANLGGRDVTIQLPELPSIHPSSGPALCSGGHGLYSTASDCLRFGELLAGRGERAGVRILSEASVRLMTTDQIAVRRRAAYPHGRDRAGDLGFGMGVAVRTAQSEETLNGSLGSYGWTSAGGSCCFVDPEHQLIGVLLEDQGGRPFAAAAFHSGVYAALPPGSE